MINQFIGLIVVAILVEAITSILYSIKPCLYRL